MQTTALMPTPKQQYFAVAGIPLVGGKIYTYAAGTSTPKATYTDAAGTAAQTNPIVLNSRGEPANAIFWAGSYKVVVQDALGNIIYTVDNYNTDPDGLWGLVAALSSSTGAEKIGYGDTTVAVALGRITTVVTSIANLRLVDKTKATTAVVSGYYSASDGGGGTFYLDVADTTSADNFVTIIVAADGGRWKLITDKRINVKQAGAKADGATDDAAAIQRAINTGLVVDFTKDNYRCGTTINLPATTWIFGNGCAIYPNGAITLFNAPVTASNVHIHGLNIVGDTPIATAFLIESSQTWLEECTTFNVQIGVISKAARFFMSGCDIRASDVSLSIEGIAEVRSIQHCILQGGGFNVNIIGGAGIRIVNCDILGGVYCLRVSPSAGEVSSLKCIGCFFDQGSTGCVLVQNTGTGSVRRFKFDSCWASGSSAGFGMSFSGNTAGIQITNSEFYGNAGNGLAASSIANLTLTGNHFAGNISRGVTVSNVDGLVMTGNAISPGGGYGGNGIGLELLGTTNNFLVVGNRINGNTTNITNSATGPLNTVANNL